MQGIVLLGLAILASFVYLQNLRSWELHDILLVIIEKVWYTVYGNPDFWAVQFVSEASMKNSFVLISIDGLFIFVINNNYKFIH